MVVRGTIFIMIMVMINHIYTILNCVYYLQYLLLSFTIFIIEFYNILLLSCVYNIYYWVLSTLYKHMCIHNTYASSHNTHTHAHAWHTHMAHAHAHTHVHGTNRHTHVHGTHTHTSHTHTHLHGTHTYGIHTLTHGTHTWHIHTYTHVTCHTQHTCKVHTRARTHTHARTRYRFQLTQMCGDTIYHIYLVKHRAFNSSHPWLIATVHIKVMVINTTPQINAIALFKPTWMAAILHT